MGAHGVRSDLVFQAILDRNGRGALRGGSGETGTREDGRKLALIVEGGGMRGTYSAGGLLALESLELNDVFDEAYGTSAGAINVAYFLSGQVSFATNIYYKFINNRNFFNPFRVRKILDVDYLIDEVVAVLRPLCVDKVLASKTRLLVGLTELERGRFFLADAQRSSEHLLTLLKASSAMPVYYNRPVEVDGKPCIDGSFRTLIPIREAIARGCTDILVLLTRPPSFRQRRPGPFRHLLFDRLCARGNRRLQSIYSVAHRQANEVRKLALGLGPTPAAVNIASLCPEEGDDPLVITTTSEEQLKAAMLSMAHQTLEAFGVPPDEQQKMLPSVP